MNFSNIYEAVDARRPLSLMSSLPVIVRRGDILEVIWFYFSYQKQPEAGNIQVSSICITEDGENIAEKHVQLQERTQWCEGEEPVMDETEYYNQLEQLYEAFDAELMESLLQQAEHPSFLGVYEKVIAYLEETEEERDFIFEE